MPYCPNCGEEYGEEISACVVCGSDLVDSLADAVGPGGSSDFEAVYSGPLARAMVLKALLEEEGCTVYLQSPEDLGDPSVAAEDLHGIAKLFVPSDSVVEALELVDSAGAAAHGPEACACPGEDDAVEAVETPAPAPASRKKPAGPPPAAPRKAGAAGGKARAAYKLGTDPVRRPGPARPSKAAMPARARRKKP